MMAPPNTFAPAAVSPSSKLVRMGDMRKKNIRLQAPSCFPVETRLAASSLAAGRRGKPRLYTKGEPLAEDRAAKILAKGEHRRREFHAALAANHRLASLRRVFDHPRLLDDDSSLC